MKGVEKIPSSSSSGDERTAPRRKRGNYNANISMQIAVYCFYYVWHSANLLCMCKGPPPVHIWITLMKMPTTVYKIQCKYYSLRAIILDATESDAKITFFKRIDWDDETWDEEAWDETWTPDMETRSQSSSEEDETGEVGTEQQQQQQDETTKVDLEEYRDPQI